ncbi:uncharacterized protein LOC123404148 [Hordeum vulgare subsp. vulgare]|uniref:uncharacterized protein LOC123404148 n=1 Tax=Hordeum vulgare subsp. vulgare TaxID=112509 RepID=UPI001D1A41B3|nr:uncharacterized protein LOC123404148 [Hordeum vulgare subsp. vulgare]
MAPAERSCGLGRFAADEAAPPETLHVVRLQRLRLRRAAEGCLHPIAEDEEYGGNSRDDNDDDVPAATLVVHTSTTTAVHLEQSRRR